VRCVAHACARCVAALGGGVFHHARQWQVLCAGVVDEDLFALRALLEGYSAARAAERITPEALAQLQFHHHEIEKSLTALNGKPDIDAFLKHNRIFHFIILEAAGSKRLTKLLTKLVEQPVVVRAKMFYELDDLINSHHQHGELLLSLKARDPVWARAMMTAHIQRSLHVFNDERVKITARTRRRNSE
jgi:DNA-binding GntR family transcriptional regulator